MHQPKNKQLSNQIKKAENLVFARQSFTPREADVFAMMLATMRPEHWEGVASPVYEFKAKDISRWLGIDPTNVYKTMKRVAKVLKDKEVGFEGSDGVQKFRYRKLFSEISYESAVLKLIPNHTLKQEYTDYSKGFSLIDTKTYISIKGEHSKRLYEVLSRFKDPEFRHYPRKIDNLKGLFGLIDESTGELKKESFKSNTFFIKTCLEDSIRQLESDPEIRKQILFQETKAKPTDKENGIIRRKGFILKKEGKRISTVEFTIKWISKINVEMTPEIADDVITRLQLTKLPHHPLTIDEEIDLLLALEYGQQSGAAPAFFSKSIESCKERMEKLKKQFEGGEEPEPEKSEEEKAIASRFDKYANLEAP